MIDINSLVGIPWKLGESEHDGADCWGIVCLFYDGVLGIDLKHFEKELIKNQRLITKKINEVDETDSRWLKTESPKYGDVVVMFSKERGRPEHVGIYLDDKKVLHSMSRDIGYSSIHSTDIINKMFSKVEYHTYVG